MTQMYSESQGGLRMLLVYSKAFQFGQKKFWIRFNSIFAAESIFSIRFGNLINLPLVH